MQTRNWTPDPSIQPLGKITISLVTCHWRFHHGLRQRSSGRAASPTTRLKAGSIGIYFATDDGEATVSVDSVPRVIMPQRRRSMTGERSYSAAQPKRA